MNATTPPTVKNEVQALRAGIRSRYRTYQQTDPDRFPDLEFNTNRDNYIPLRESFEAEFYHVRGYSRTTRTVVIPSTTTLAQLFTNDSYVPGWKILNTCQSYAAEPVQEDVESAVMNRTPASTEAARPPRKWAGSLLGVSALGVLIFVGLEAYQPAPSNLVITRPARRSTVPREVVVKGEVAHAKTVWVVIRSNANGRCWVQPPIPVNDTGLWLGAVYVGRASGKDDGLTYQLRAFVNPADKLREGDVLDTWPRAELSTETIEVVRETLSN